MIVGKFIKQPEGYLAFIPTSFPNAEFLQFPSEILVKAAARNV